MAQHIEIKGWHPTLTPEQAYEVLNNVEDHVRLTDVVRSVRTEPIDEATRLSHWEVQFRNGIMRWSQRDHFVRETWTMTFELVAGDPGALNGFWRAEASEEGCRVHLVCEFEMGIPTLEDALGPLAGRILRETLRTQLFDIFGPEFQFDEQPDPAVPSSA
jgi:ribosome-associated toxin RatA of RatAB toxin-antitoxin module